MLSFLVDVVERTRSNDELGIKVRIKNTFCWLPYSAAFPREQRAAQNTSETLSNKLSLRSDIFQTFLVHPAHYALGNATSRVIVSFSHLV